jgi:N-acetylmuramoyl-L-alanine amidase
MLPRILIVDAGHGGSDPGAIGPTGAREADLALSLARALAQEFEGDPEVEVRLTRDRDVEIPLWSRGEMATEWKGDRPGVFISIHMNALSGRPGVRGFETYFLSEARDEHERRVAALENASLPAASSSASQGSDPLLAALLRDLQAFDHQHWSADLAEVVQLELSTFHPGADRGVKQGPFAVITNSLMPSVLVEVGFITSPEEERLLGRSEFQRDTARALARAVRAFFERYPPRGNP